MDEQPQENSHQLEISRVSTELQSRLIRELNFESDIKKMMDDVVTTAAELLQASACTVFTIDREGTRKGIGATQISGTGYQKEFNGKSDVDVVPASRVLEEPDTNQKLGLTGWIISTGKPFLARSPEEVKKHQHHRGLLEKSKDIDLNLQSFLGVPIRNFYGEVTGMIKAERLISEKEDEPRVPFSCDDQLALETFARVANRCITYQEMAKRNQETEAITSWSRNVIVDAVATQGDFDSFLNEIVTVTAAAMQADSCGIFLKDEGGSTLTQRAGNNSQALRSVIRAYPLLELDEIDECNNISLCSPSCCPHAKTLFMINSLVLEMLKKTIPKEIIEKLTEIKDQEFSQDIFQKKLKKLLGNTGFNKYKKLILKNSKKGIGLTAWIAVTGKSFYARNYLELSAHCHHRGGFDTWNFPEREHTLCGAFLGVPLRIGGEIIGVIKVENISKIGIKDSREFTRADRQRFDIISQDIAIAIKRLQNQLPNRYTVILKSKKTFQDILQGGLSLPDLVKKVVTETKSLFDAGACALFLKEGNKLIQPPWAASGWAQKGPEVREYELVKKEEIIEIPTTFEEKVGLTVWIAVNQKKFTAKSNLELRMHPHHKGTYDKHNFEEGEQCESFMGVPLVIKVGNENELVGVLKVETKMRGEHEYTYFNELDELVFELIANSIAIVIKNVRQEAELLRSRQISSLGVMASGLAHEINQPLQIILGKAQNCINDIKFNAINQDGIIKDLNNIAATIKRIDRIVNHLRVLSKEHKPRLEYFDVHNVIKNSFMLFNEQLKIRGIIVEEIFDSNLPEVRADMVQLEQVFNNLITNARDALEEKTYEEVDNKKIIISTKVHKEKINITFEDTGKGVPYEDLPYIFDAFFTRKENGIGLGLYITKDIIKKYNGGIEVNSQLSKGTTFTIILPIVEKEKDDESR